MPRSGPRAVRKYITFLKVNASWRYLAIVMDQHTRRILAWTLTRRCSAHVTSAVLILAAARRAIFHSDRGSEYIGSTLLRDGGALGHAPECEREGDGRQCARRVVLPFAQDRAHPRRRVCKRAYAACRAHGLHALLQHHPPTLGARVSLASCLRTARSINHTCQHNWCKIPSTFRMRLRRNG